MNTNSIPWKRYEIPKSPRAWTEARRRAAGRAVARDRARTPLFPGLARWDSVETRMSDMDEREAAIKTVMRAGRAGQWRKARARLHALPGITRQGLLRYFRISGVPHDPVYLLELLRQVTRGESPWTWLRQLHLLRHHTPKLASPIRAHS